MEKRERGKKGRKTVGCPVETTIEAIGGRWKMLIVQHLFEGNKRFGELGHLLVGLQERTLTRKLRQLEASGIITRKVFPEVPSKVEYSLTPRGKGLRSVLRAMQKWGEPIE